MKIVILRDALGPTVTLDDLDNQNQVSFVKDILSSKHQVDHLFFSSDIESTKKNLTELKPDLVFNLVESCCGLGALSVMATQLLEVMNIPFTGNRSFAHLLSADKRLAKKFLQQNNISTPCDKFEQRQQYILKAVFEHASIGLDESSVICPETKEQLESALKEKEKQKKIPFMAERYIKGEEYNVAVLGDTILPPAQMCFDPSFEGHMILTYNAKWDEKNQNYLKSNRSFEIDDTVCKKMVEMTHVLKNKLFLFGYARIDFRVDAQGVPYVIDVNTNPCIAPDSGFMAMARQAGLCEKDVLERIVDYAFVSY